MIIMVVYFFFLLVSMVGAFISSNWFLIWLWVELNSLCLIPILSGDSSLRCVESTIKYYVFQAFGSVTFLLGILFRYFFYSNLSVLGDYGVIPYFLVVLGLCIKAGVFPLHFWFVDVISGLKFYEGAFVAVVSKVIPIYLLIILSGQSSLALYSLIGLGSVIIGSIFGLSQLQLRKILSLSSVSHLGWLIVLFPYLVIWVSGSLFFVYVLMTLPLFWIGGFYSVEHYFKVKGLWSNFSFVFVFVVSILSLAGFPPLLGFFYKWVMLYFLVIKGNYLMVAILILLSLVSLYFYLNLVFSLVSFSWSNVKFFLSGGGGFGWLLLVSLIVYHFLIFILTVYIGPLNVEFSLSKL
uniref:NADH-ubiquinone oxidoreductase chain 2 n=1 Tax=Ophiocreas oedipus TaxID=876696 RepID=A0A8K1RQ75_9ECHI|nr:NADH dehydrogenase subunit 2 [Ophiocreas oedipus]